MKGSPQNSSGANSAATQAAEACQRYTAAQEGDAHHADLQYLQQYSPCFLKPLCITPKQICKPLSIQDDLRVFWPLQDHMGCLETSAMTWPWAMALEITMHHPGLGPMQL